MKIVKSTGLAVVKVLDASVFLTKTEGEVFGIAPEKAKALAAAGKAEILDPPAEDSEDFSDESESDPAEGSDVIDIPADWASLHHKKRIALANRLLGDQAKAETAEEADVVIAAEIAKRAA